MPLRPVVAALALVSSLALAACGSDGGGKTEEENATPAQARAEIGEVRAALDSAVAAMKEGDPKAAENAVSEGYLQHFEKVEGPLEKVDAELNEKLEDGIREDLRDDIKARKPAAEVEQAVEALLADLDKAEALLR